MAQINPQEAAERAQAAAEMARQAAETAQQYAERNGKSYEAFHCDLLPPRRPAQGAVQHGDRVRVSISVDGWRRPFVITPGIQCRRATRLARSENEGGTSD